MSDMMLMVLAGLGAEITLLLLVLLSVSWFRQRGARRRDDKAIRALIARIRKTRPERAAAVEGFLAAAHVAEDERARALPALLSGELGVLQRFASLYRQRDAGAAASFDLELYALLDAYHDLAAGYGAAAPAELVTADSTPIEDLREENSRLTEELRITMETMSRMLNEYSSMFAGESAEGIVPGAVGGAAGMPAAATYVPDAHESDDEGIELEEPTDATQDGDIEVAMDDVADEPAAVDGDIEGLDEIADILEQADDDEFESGDMPTGEVDAEVAALDDGPADASPDDTGRPPGSAQDDELGEIRRLAEEAGDLGVELSGDDDLFGEGLSDEVPAVPQDRAGSA